MLNRMFKVLGISLLLVFLLFVGVRWQLLKNEYYVHKRGPLKAACYQVQPGMSIKEARLLLEKGHPDIDKRSQTLIYEWSDGACILTIDKNEEKVLTVRASPPSFVQ
jgi:hypothetical protein